MYIVILIKLIHDYRCFLKYVVFVSVRKYTIRPLMNILFTCVAIFNF